jgi:hypothetical protein
MVGWASQLWANAGDHYNAILTFGLQNRPYRKDATTLKDIGRGILESRATLSDSHYRHSLLAEFLRSLSSLDSSGVSLTNSHQGIQDHPPRGQESGS